MPDESTIDLARLQRLERALEDVRTLRDVWATCAAGREPSDQQNAAFSEAFDRLERLAGVLTEDVRDMTGIESWDIGGRQLDLFYAAVVHNPMDATVFGPPMRVNELRNLEGLLSRTIGLVNEGYKPYRQRMAREPQVSVFEQARQRVLEMLFRARGSGTIPSAADLAGQSGAAAQEVEDDLRILEDQGLIVLQRGMGGPESLTAELTARGLQRAREGISAVGPSAGVSQSNTFLAHGATINLAQSGTGPVFQTVQQSGQIDDVKLLLTELARSIAALDVSEAEREEYLVYVEQLTEELARPEPRPSMIKIPWTGLGRIADIAGTVQGAAMVQDLIGRLTPHIAQLLQQA